MVTVEFHKLANMKKLKNPVIVLGFPGTGLVGSVAAAHMIDALNLEFGGYISSDEFAPLAAIHDYTPMPAARIHFSKELNLVVILSEMSIPVSASNELADEIFKFAKSVGAKQIISLGGISLKEKGTDIYIISSDRKAMNNIINKKIAKPIREGATTGVTGLLLTMGTLMKFPVMTLLAESSEDYLDPGASSKVLKALSNVTGFKINTAKLDKEAKGIKSSMIKSKITKKGKFASEGGSMYG